MISIDKNNFDRFQKIFDAEIKRQIKPEYLDNNVFTDGELSIADFNLQLAEVLRTAEPWGQAFPEPVSDGRFLLTEQRIVGEKHLKMRLQPKASNQEFDAIAFNVIEPGESSSFVVGAEIQAAYKLDVNEFRGQKNLQLLVEYIELA